MLASCDSPIDSTNAVDEMNLCEFPLALLSDRTAPNQLELNYSDTLWDESAKEHIQRTLRVSAPPAYGLPTAKDEEVLLALIHYTDVVNQFTSPTVAFGRYELINLLGWNTGGKSYARIRESLARWKSVTLDYRNAWRCHRTRSWVSELFSIIDNVTLYDVEEQRRGHSPQIDLPLSSFTWNRVFFESMQARYFKRLDFTFYQQLQTPTSKRLFRFLDKRFGSGRHSWDFELREFAFEHIGLSRNYDTGKIKEKLSTAIAELEACGYLTEMPRDVRYTKHGKQWRVRFVRASAARPDVKPEEKSDAASLLRDRGISQKAAAELASEFGEQQIHRQVDIFDWIVEHHADSLKNPGGFLAESIRSGFAPPSGYKTPEEREQAAALRQKRHAANSQRVQQQRDEDERRQQEREHVASLRASLSDQSLRDLEEQALAVATQSQQEALASPTFREFQLQLMVDQLLLEKYPLTSKVVGTADSRRCESDIPGLVV